MKDAERNRRLADQFHLKEKEYPTLLLTDKDGQPIGIPRRLPERRGHAARPTTRRSGRRRGRPERENFIRRGRRKGFRRMLKQWRKIGDEYPPSDGQHQDPVRRGAEKAIGKLLDLLEINDLDRFYQPQIREWLAVLPRELQKRPVAITLGRLPPVGHAVGALL